MTVANSQSTGAIIQRRLSPNSFITSDPQECVAWLQRLEYVPIPTVHRTEVGRLEHLGLTFCVFASGLVIMIGGGA